MLTSSAVGGRRAAPRAPPRRREAPKTTDQSAADGQSTTAAATHPDGQTVEQQHGPNQRDESVVEEARSPPPPPVVVERSVATTTTLDSARQSQNDTSDRTHSIAHPAPTAISDPSVATPVTSAPTDGEPRLQATQSTKRSNYAFTNDGAPASKRVRITRSTQYVSEQATQAQSFHADFESVIHPQSSHSAHHDNAATTAQPAQSQSQPSVRRRIEPRREDGPDASTSTVATRQRSRTAATSTPSLPSTDRVASSPRPARQRRKKATVVTGGPSTNAEDGADNASRSSHESDTEKHEIDPVTLSMYDLSHDSKHGKTSEREKKMAKIDWVEVARKRREEADAILKGDLQPEQEGQPAVQSTEGDDGIAQSSSQADQTHQQQNDDNGSSSNGQSTSRPEPVTRPSGAGVRFRIVGGQLVEDEASLTIDRAARVVQAAADTAEPVEEENDLTTRFNRTTYINARKRDPTERVPLWRSKSDAWTEEDTDRFYDALRMFGTDFFIISKMFPPRTRKQIKLKFVREERLEPDRVNAALLGRHTRRIDLDHYAQAINRDVSDFHKYDGLEHANEVIRASMKDKEEAMRAAVKEDEENNRQREAQRQQREKQRLEAEKKKEERAKKKAMQRRGNVWGAGTLGGADDDNDED